MKKLYLFITLFIPMLLVAQNNEGKIVYSETSKLEINLPEEHREQLKDVLPTSRTNTKELYFNASESIYKDAPNQEDETHEMGSESSGFHFKMKVHRPDNQYYKNIAENKIIDKQEFFDRNFLVTEDIQGYQWKLVNEQKEILGYTCQKAMIEGEKPIEAWFTPQIPVPNGPLEYGQLPGMILEINIGNSDTHIVATEVRLMSLEKDKIDMPKKGKKVNREEFDKIVKEKTKEMEETHGGNRVIMHKG